jgi:lysophospholipase L1-like esterase
LSAAYKIIALLLAGMLACACTAYVGESDGDDGDAFIDAGEGDGEALPDSGTADDAADDSADSDGAADDSADSDGAADDAADSDGAAEDAADSDGAADAPSDCDTPDADGGDQAGDVDPCGPSECERDSDCPVGEVCVAGGCGPVRWEPEANCGVVASGCATGPFPDDCYQAGTFLDCPARAEPIGDPACTSFLELGVQGPEDDELVIRLLYDLWVRGRQSALPTRPRVVMPLGDSISATLAYITARSFECSLPDFTFDAGYRLVGQPGTWDVVLAALGNTTAEWGRSVVEAEDWYQEIRPEMATVMFGTNELWNGNQGLESYVTHMRAIVDRLLEHYVIPILITLPPGTYRIRSAREICGEWCADLAVNYHTEDFAQAVRDLAAERLVPLVDLHRRYVEYDKGSWGALLSDGVHPCHQDCLPGVEHTGAEIRDDAVLRMIKFLEARALDRCPGSLPPPEPPGYQWDDEQVLSNFIGAEPKSYCPDPVVTCR